MSASPVRPARRAAARRKLVVDSDEDEENIEQQQNDDSGEEFTPAPARSTKRAPQRKTTDVAATPKTAARTRRTRTGDSVEPSQLFSPPESVIGEEPTSPSKAPSPRKRRSVKDARIARKSHISIVPDAIPEFPPSTPALPTPQTSISPEPQSRHGTPLADITEQALNESRQPKPVLDIVHEVKKIDARTTVLEKPMDIVVRTRAVGNPLSQEHAPPKSRIVITYLVLTNFKSYAGRQEVGPFHASFSSVVGPNGSGKSNVIDSLLFVFGFRASKMRQGKISALIHNSAAFPDLDHCEVEVHFQEVEDLPGGGHSVVPDSTLVVSRRAFKNNASKYYINGRESNFTVVTTLLRDRGVDLDHKRFLILQGEVESIAQMKPKAANEHDDGLLEYLEDIIGTSKYKTPIEEAAAETEAYNEVCAEKSTRVQHVEKEKNVLVDKKDKALAFIRDENELAVKQSALYQIYIDECGDNVAVTDEAIAEMQAQLNGEMEKHQGNEEDIKRLEKQYKAGSREYERLEKETQAVLKEMAKLDKETVKFEEKKKFLSNKARKLEKTQESSDFSTREAETLMKQADDDATRCAKQIEDLEMEMLVEDKELGKIRESLKGKTQGFSDQIAAKRKKLEPWNVKVSEKQSATAVAQSELDILRERETSGATAIAEVEAKIVGLHEAKEAKASELAECHSQKKTVLREVRSLQAEIEQLVAKEPAVRSKLSSARQKADEARASLSATQTQGNVLTGLMRLKDSGRINGFHGRLGNLGAIEQKYDVAISTACPALDNLVVDSVEVGQQCIDYLRKNNLGRANFICLDRLPQRDLSPKETPDNVPRLFDLVKSKHDRFRPAFYSVLQDTLVAKDLEQANRIAYGAKRWRVVTLDGQLIDKSGTMSGGGTRVAKGGMSSKLVADTSKEVVTKLEVDRDALEQVFSDLQQSQRDLEAQLKELHDQVPKLETQSQKLEMELGSFDRNIADAERRIQELGAGQQSSKSDKNRVSALEKNIDLMAKEIEKLQSGMAVIEDEIKSLQDKIMEIGGVKLRSQKAKVDGLKGQIDTLTEEMSTAEVAKAKAGKQKTKSEKDQAEAGKELEKVTADLEKVDEDMKTQTRDASGSRRQGEEAQEALETKKEELQALKIELDRQTAELNETRGVEIEMRNKLEESQKILAENQKRLNYWQEKLGKLTVQNISDSGEELEPEPLPSYTKDELADMSKEGLKASIAQLEERTSTAVELSVLADYRRRVEEHTTRSADLATSLAARDAAKSRADSLRRLRLEGFMAGFSAISLRLKEMYQMITMGGNAELELVDSLDPFSEGILFSVMPPKKSWKNIGNLSGGEKTLSSLALVFALHHYKPTPLYVMDEIDAALDFRNVSIVASYIKERTKNAQFIVISLRNNMFELASRLVGVYKVNHMTKSVTVENRDYITAGA
ncbi:Structural maintenance of chromosomes protein 4 [Elasticomyces elasticus]|nr:Structural maintenance of chromosomes protein 4 [Elasticomyces elasticus]KAK4992830.1 Structural maintenance of chromosomes protein 4 [Elasticomyces elasticus]